MYYAYNLHVVYISFMHVKMLISEVILMKLLINANYVEPFLTLKYLAESTLEETFFRFSS